jgi:hypothetical protein
VKLLDKPKAFLIKQAHIDDKKAILCFMSSDKNTFEDRINSTLKTGIQDW